MSGFRDYIIRILRWSERYTKTDMVYLASGGMWLTGQQVFSAIFALGLAIAFGHFASQDTYGNYKYALSLAALLAAFSLTGIGPAITQATARGHEGSLWQGFSVSMRWGSLMVVLGLMGSVYYWLEGNFFVAVSLLIVSLVSPLHVSLSLFSSFLIGKHDFKRSAYYSALASAVPSLAVIATLFVLDERAIYLVVVYFIATIAVHIYCFAQSASRASNASKDPDLVSYGSHLSVMGFVATIADRIDSIIVFSILGPVGLAVYTYAMAIPEQIKGLFKNIGTLSMAKFAVRPLADIKATIWLRLVYFACALSLSILAYVVLAPLIFRYLFPVYEEAVFYSQIYALSIILTAFIYPITAILQSHKKTRELYITTNVSSIFLIALLPILTYKYGIGGAILSQVLYRVANALLHTWQFIKSKD